MIGPDSILAVGAGTAQMHVRVPRSGRYEIWMQGSVGRPLAFYLDGRRLATLGYEERYPNQFLLVAEPNIDAGGHTLTIKRGNGSLHPGSGDPATDTIGRTLGAIVFTQGDPSASAVHVVPARDAARVCLAPLGYQWLEIVRPGT